jgi:hypothetical protein
MSRAKKHHQVPQFYLRTFADAKGRVTVFDRRTGRSWNQRVEEVATNTNLYTVRDRDGRPSDVVEQALADAEGTVAGSVGAMLAPTPHLVDVDRAQVAFFVALQFIRTAAMRDQLENILDLNTRMMVEANVGGDPPDQVERFIRQRYADAPEWLKDQIRGIAADPSKRIELPTEEWTGHFAPLIHDLAGLLLRRGWWLASAADRAFLTCDDPVVLTVTPGDLPGVGFANAAQVLIALSPHRVLVMEAVAEVPFGPVPVDRDWIRWVNRTIANRADRHVFWHPRSEPLKGIQVPPMPRPASVNGIPVERGERSWDKLRPHRLPHMHRIRDEIRAGHRKGSDRGSSDP